MDGDPAADLVDAPDDLREHALGNRPETGPVADDLGPAGGRCLARGRFGQFLQLQVEVPPVEEPTGRADPPAGVHRPGQLWIVPEPLWWISGQPRSPEQGDPAVDVPAEVLAKQFLVEWITEAP